MPVSKSTIVSLKHTRLVTEMSINELELELEILEMAYDIFKGTAVGEVITFSDPIKDAKKAYGERIRDLKNEIFERSVLVQS